MKFKFIFFLLVLFIFISSNLSAGILTSKHNLSVSGVAGPNAILALTEKRVCIFCHTPHNALADAPLWNRSAGAARQYTPYSSSTINFIPGQPTGSSILCLSCHDGTIALGGGVAVGGPITMANGVTTMPITAKGHMGLDLSNDHPISFRYTSALATTAGELVDPVTLPNAVKLDANSELQCTTCHDAHNDVNGQFLVMTNRGSALCETCHIKSQWNNSPHNTSTSTWNNVAPDPWPNSNFTTVADNACGNCHAAHNAGVAERLFTQITEEDVCYVCHNGNVTSDVQSDFMQASAHPLNLAVAVHQPAKVETAPAQLRHVECIDCHNAHAASVNPIGVVGISGVDWNGIEVKPITQKDQLCFKCHESSPNRGIPLIPRDKSQMNVRLEYEIINPSFHPIRAVAKIGSQSLLPPWIPAPLVAGVTPGPGVNTFTQSCFECHMDKPHGSPSAALLKLNMVITDGTPESPITYELCYSCHDRNIILGDTTFKEHNRHIVGETTSCVTCHTPHGASLVAGATTTNNLRLINFSTTQVTPSGGVLTWTGTGNNTGSCTLICHGENHAPQGY